LLIQTNLVFVDSLFLLVELVFFKIKSLLVNKILWNTSIKSLLELLSSFIIRNSSTIMELFLHLLGSSEPPLQSSSEESPSNYMLSASSLLMLLLPFSSSELSLEYIPISPSSSLGVLLKKVTSSEVNVMSFRCSILNSRFASTCRRCYHFVERYQFQPYSQKVRSCCK